MPKTDAEHAAWLSQTASGLRVRVATAMELGDDAEAARLASLARDCEAVADRLRTLGAQEVDQVAAREQWRANLQRTVERACAVFREVREAKRR